MESSPNPSETPEATEAGNNTISVADPPTTEESSSTVLPPAEEDSHKRKREEPSEKQEEENSSAKRLRLRPSSRDVDFIPLRPTISPEETATTTSTYDAAEDSSKRSVGEANNNSPPKTKGKPNEKIIMRVNQMAEEFVELSSRMMLIPTTNLGPFGYDETSGGNNNQHQINGENNGQRSYPLELLSSLGYLKSPLRRPTVMERWSPYEVSLFEAGMGHYGKDFYQIHKLIQTKSTKEVIDFYYIWKKTSHYKVWKERYVAPGEILADEDTNATPVKKPVR